MYDKKEKESMNQLKKKVGSTRESLLTRKFFMNSILSSLNISEIYNEKKKTLVYVEDGNNSRMVKEIFRKRPQITFTNDKNEANIIWTRFCDYDHSNSYSKFK